MLKRILYITISIIVLGSIIWTIFFLYQNSNKPKIKYESIRLEKRNILKKVIITGSIVPRKEVLIKPKVPGIISKIFKKPGDKIKKGEIIGLIKVIPNMAQLNEAYVRIERSVVNLNNAKIEFDRITKLFSQKLVPQTDFVTRQTAFKNAEIEWVAAKNNLKIIQEGSASEQEATNTQIASTIFGTILDIPIKEGSVVIESNNFNQGTTIASVADISNLIFEGKVDESIVGKLSINRELEVTIGAIDGKTYKARLEYLAPKGKNVNSTIFFTLKAALILKKNEQIRVGYSATAEVVLDKRLDVLSIPESCVEYSVDSAFVYLFDSTKTKKPYQKTFVELGLSDGIYVELKKGLSPTQRIRGNKKMEKEY